MINRYIILTVILWQSYNLPTLPLKDTHIVQTKVFLNGLHTSHAAEEIRNKHSVYWSAEQVCPVVHCGDTLRLRADLQLKDDSY